MLLQTTMTAAAASPFHCHPSVDLSHRSSAVSLPKTLFLSPLDGRRFYCGNASMYTNENNNSVRTLVTTPRATLIETPALLWAGRLCIYYALLKAGLAGSHANPLVSDLETGAGDLGFAQWFNQLSKPEKEAAEKRKLVSKWHPTTKGTLRRNYRIPSKSEGKHLLRAIASVLSDDDQFRIRRENAHGESVCCNIMRRETL